MAIVQLDKVTLYGAESYKESVLNRLQQLGCVHLVDLAMDREDFTSSDSSKDTRDALRYLRECPEQRRQVVRKMEFDRRQIVNDVLNVQRDANQLRDERDELRVAIDDLEPWGEFQLSTECAIGEVKLWFFEIPIQDLIKLEEADVSWHEISRDARSAYILILHSEKPQNVPGKLCELDSRPLSELHARLEEVEEQLEELRHQRVGLTRWCDLLNADLDEADDSAAREHAMRKTLDGQNVYAVQGWAPCDSADAIRRFADDNNLAVTIEPPSENDSPPTLLHNPEGLAGGEALVTFYKTPGYRSWDPSIITLVSFAIFFAMIMSDAGYGLLLALLTAYLWKKMGKTLSGRRGRIVLASVVGATIVYGVLCGSYFGVTPAADSFLGKLAIIDATSQSLMLPLTIAIGVIHLSLANTVMAWSHRGRSTALASLGWVFAMIGAATAGFATMSSIDAGVAGWLSWLGGFLFVSGLLGVFLFSSERPLLSWNLKNHVLRIVDGLSGLTGMSGLFGDVLSYLRLFALGLSSAKLSATFNSLGASAWDSAGFGVLAAIAIVILGHTINLMLGIMSGVVHGLRLICIEFFKWSLPEEGYLFKAFAKKARSA